MTGRITNMLLRFLTQILLVLVSAPALAADPVSVTVQRLGDVLIDKEVRAPATVISANRALVTSEVSALIQEVPVDVGDTISQGEPLVVLEDSNNRLMQTHAKARLAALKAQIAFVGPGCDEHGFRAVGCNNADFVSRACIIPLIHEAS